MAIIRQHGGGPNNCFVRFLSLLDISMSLCSGTPLLLESDLIPGDTKDDALKFMTELSVIDHNNTQRITELNVILRDGLKTQSWRGKLRTHSCVIYLHQIMDPTSQHSEVIEAVKEILEIADTIPEGGDIEVGLH